MGSSVVLAVAFISATCLPAQAAGRDGGWEGITSQDHPVVMTVRDAQVMFFRIVVEYPDCGSWERIRARHLGVAIRDDGSFRVHMSRTTGKRDTLTILGTFTAPKRVSGTFKAVNVSACDGERVRGTWKAAKR
jgi:hypothetical protein